MGDLGIFHNVCRICTEETDGVSIYSEEGKKDSLEEKIRKFLFISISEEDILPKMVCADCKTKLNNMEEFATMAAKMQTKLLECLHIHSTSESNSYGTVRPAERMAKWQSQFKKDETVQEKDEMKSSLLHSILTKGQPQTQEDVTIEVPIDPMTILCEDENDEDEDEQKDEEEEAEEADSENENEDRVDESQDGEAEASQSSTAQSEEQDEKTEKSSRSEESSSSSDTPRRFKIVTESKPYQCAICPRGFNSDIGLQNHLWSHLPHARKLANKTQHPVYSTNGVIRTVTTGNSTPPPLHWRCPICNRNMSTKGNLKIHMETHVARGKYPCDICNRVFQTQSNLYRHKLMHAGSQCLCAECGRVYPTQSTLKAHQITHSNLRPHKCNLCDKTFKRNQDLKFHINQHTGERPYRCPYCPKAFASSGNCFSHRKRMHPKQLAFDKSKKA